ncbi:hypothetical protein Pmar_PMAR009817, partial [Perkinsus marinus ATCC 50983]
YANVLPEPREELLREDLWRYRTEFITSVEDNKLLIQLRQKAYWVESVSLVLTWSGSSAHIPAAA